MSAAGRSHCAISTSARHSFLSGTVPSVYDCKVHRHAVVHEPAPFYETYLRYRTNHVSVRFPFLVGDYEKFLQVCRPNRFCLWVARVAMEAPPPDGADDAAPPDKQAASPPLMGERTPAVVQQGGSISAQYASAIAEQAVAQAEAATRLQALTRGHQARSHADGLAIATGSAADGAASGFVSTAQPMAPPPTGMPSLLIADRVGDVGQDEVEVEEKLDPKEAMLQQTWENLGASSTMLDGQPKSPGGYESNANLKAKLAEIRTKLADAEMREKKLGRQVDSLTSQLKTTSDALKGNTESESETKKKLAETKTNVCDGC